MHYKPIKLKQLYMHFIYAYIHKHYITYEEQCIYMYIVRKILRIYMFM